MGRWTKKTFITRFKTYDPKRGYVPHLVKQGEPQSLMPWTMYGGMSEQDLGAIYTYLRTLKPIRNRVETFSVTGPATLVTVAH